MIDYSTLFSFPLDDFQIEAFQALDAGKSVVVCAPTGSGKTLIGEYAIHRALSQGKRVFYTTPLKALSNQKLRDFRDHFGPQLVGLLTGDNSINRDAPIVVMTTEIFRNMLYGTRIGEVGTSLADVQTVVLDECHYMNDRQRGTVWEESIIYCPKEIQLAALSATVANSDQLTDWLTQVHGPTALIYSDYRPVPLEFHFGNIKGLFPLLNDKQNKVNSKLIQGAKKGSREEGVSITNILAILKQRDMLPAIYFIFSRKGCDRAVEEVGNITLVNPHEAAQINLSLQEFLERNPDAARIRQVEPLKRGIAAHHAGILPAWKVLIEELFQKGLVKVVFATETLAAGINMPARTTVISSISKRTDDGHRLLTAAEFLQMAGRAGRRGMDTVGHVVTLQTPFQGARDAAQLATSKAEPLVSQFSPSYGMVLNLLQTHSLSETKELVERSFGQYLGTIDLKADQIRLQEYKDHLEIKKTFISQIDGIALEEYEKLHNRLKNERRILKKLQTQAGSYADEELALALSFAVSGTFLSLKGPHVPTSSPISAVLVVKVPGSGQAPYLVCLAQDNKWRIVTMSDIVQLHGEIPRLSKVDNLTIPNFDAPPKAGQIRKGDSISLAVAQLIPSLTQDETPEVIAQKARVTELEHTIKTHPIYQWGNPAKLLKQYHQDQIEIAELSEEIDMWENYLQQKIAHHWQEFVKLIEVLRESEALNDVIPTALGETAAAIRGDNELWLGIVLSSGRLDHLEPHHLAAACGALVTEISRPDTWTSYLLSPEATEALKSLWDLRKALIKVQLKQEVEVLVLPEKREHFRLMAIIEQWASGVTWSDLAKNTSLDEGDLVRILRRTVDLLSQIPYVPHLSSDLYKNARIAIDLMDRFPVNEELD